MRKKPLLKYKTYTTMVNMYSIKKKFYMALGIFSFFTLCGFLSAPLNAHTEFFNINTLKSASTELNFSISTKNPLLNKKNGSIQLTITDGAAPFKIVIYSTNMPIKEYIIANDLTITNLAAGEYMIVVSGGNNQYRSRTITLRQE